MSLSHFPRRGDRVNDSRRIPFGNGFVVRVLYDDGPDEVIVKFDNGTEFYDFEEFRWTWTDHYGGAFILHHKPARKKMPKVTVTMTYEYEGEEKNNKHAAVTEKKYWATGAVGYDDLVASGGEVTLDVTVEEFGPADAERVEPE